MKKLLGIPQRAIELAVGLGRGGRDRHKAAARLRAVKLRARWRIRRAALRRPVAAIALVEHMGDIVAAEPVVRMVRERHPDAHLVWVVRRSFRDLIEHHPDIDEAVTVGCLGEWLSLASAPPFDVVYDLHVPGRECNECRMHVVGDGSHDIRIGNYFHHGNLLQIFCRCAGLPLSNDGPRLHRPETVARSVDRFALPEDFVALHCTSNQDVRDWSTPKWQELVAALSADGIATVEVGLKPLVAPGTATHTDLCGRLSLLETAEVIARARVFVGIDSGPAHLANAVGTRGVILLGHYRSYTRYMPYSGAYADGTNANVLYGDGPASTLPVERVRDAVRQAWDRQPVAAGGGAP